MRMAAATARREGPGRLAQWREGVRRLVRRSWSFFGGLLLSAAAIFTLVALITYHPSDPSLNTDAAGPVQNWMGSLGAWTSDFLLMMLGPTAGLLLPVILVIGLRLARGVEAGQWLRALLVTALGIALVGAAAGLFAGGAVNGLPAGWGGAIGLALAGLIDWLLSILGDSGIVAPFRIALIAILAAIGLALCLIGLGLTAEERRWLAARRLRAEDADLDEEDYAPPADRPARAPMVLMLTMRP